MDILIWFKLVSFVLSVAVIFWSWHKLLSSTSHWLFAVMISLFFTSTILFFPEGDISDWLKHIPFYLGQLLFYFFIKQIFTDSKIKDHDISANHPASSIKSIVLMNGSQLAGTTKDSSWFHFLTEQGIQHIIVLPFFFVIAALVGSEYVTITQPALKKILNLLLLAGLSLVMIHIGEFVVESQGWLPFLEGDPIEIIEFLWYYLGIGSFFLAIHQFKAVSHP